MALRARTGGDDRRRQAHVVVGVERAKAKRKKIGLDRTKCHLSLVIGGLSVCLSVLHGACGQPDEGRPEKGSRWNVGSCADGSGEGGDSGLDSVSGCMKGKRTTGKSTFQQETVGRLSRQRLRETPIFFILLLTTDDSGQQTADNGQTPAARILPVPCTNG